MGQTSVNRPADLLVLWAGQTNKKTVAGLSTQIACRPTENIPGMPDGQSVPANNPEVESRTGAKVSRQIVDEAVLRKGLLLRSQ